MSKPNEPMLRGLGYENLIDFIRECGYEELAKKIQDEIWLLRLIEGRKIR